VTTYPFLPQPGAHNKNYIVTPAKDYPAGSGKRIHSGYGRYSLSGIVGLTPDKDTLLELAYEPIIGNPFRRGRCTAIA